MAYHFPELPSLPSAVDKEVLLVANGDLRLSANQNCWPAQHAMEQALTDAVSACGHTLRRAHGFKEDEQHGFIGSQKEGLEVFARIDPASPLIVPSWVDLGRPSPFETSILNAPSAETVPFFGNRCCGSSITP